MKIRIYLLRQDRTVKIVKVGEKKQKWHYNNGLYPINPQDINLSAYTKTPNPTPELIFIEGNPRAVGSNIDAIETFDSELFQNFVKAASSPRSMIFQQIMELIFSPKLIIVVFAIILLVTFLMGLNGWNLKNIIPK